LKLISSNEKALLLPEVTLNRRGKAHAQRCYKGKKSYSSPTLPTFNNGKLPGSEIPACCCNSTPAPQAAWMGIFEYIELWMIIGGWWCINHAPRYLGCSCQIVSPTGLFLPACSCSVDTHLAWHMNRMQGTWFSSVICGNVEVRLVHSEHRRPCGSLLWIPD
jgi:hypothetical protein